MDELEIMRARHSVRAFEKRPIEAIAAERLKSEIEACNAAGDLKIRLVMGDADAFDSFLAHYGTALRLLWGAARIDGAGARIKYLLGSGVVCQGQDAEEAEPAKGRKADVCDRVGIREGTGESA